MLEILFACLFAAIGGGSSDDKKTAPAESQSCCEILINQETTTNVKAYYPLFNAQDVPAIYQSGIDVNNDAYFDFVDMVSLAIDLAYYVPQDYTGVVSLDWEGLIADQVWGVYGQAVQAQGVQQMLAALQFAKSYRPNAKIGYYSIPLLNYNLDVEQMIQFNAPLLPLLNECEVFLPSIYDMTKDYESQWALPEYDIDAVRISTLATLQMAGNKPVYMYVHHRYHDSNPISGGYLIDDTEFKNHVGVAIKTELNGRHVNGVVWWGTDFSLYDLSQQSLPPSHPMYLLSLHYQQVFQEEIPAGADVAAYFDELHLDILQDLVDTFNAAMLN